MRLNVPDVVCGSQKGAVPPQQTHRKIFYQKLKVLKMWGNG